MMTDERSESVCVICKRPQRYHLRDMLYFSSSLQSVDVARFTPAEPPEPADRAWMRATIKTLQSERDAAIERAEAAESVLRSHELGGTFACDALQFAVGMAQANKQLAAVTAERDAKTMTVESLEHRVEELENYSHGLAVCIDDQHRLRDGLEAQLANATAERDKLQIQRATAIATEVELRVCLEEVTTERDAMREALQKIAGWDMINPGDGKLDLLADAQWLRSLVAHALDAAKPAEPAIPLDIAEQEWARLEGMTDEEVVKESADRTRAKMLKWVQDARAAKARLMGDPTLYAQPAEPKRCTCNDPEEHGAMMNCPVHGVAQPAEPEQREFWAYYADYDWVALCQLFGTMVQLPKGFPQFCMDLKQLSVMKGSPRHSVQDGDLHHALADARWNAELYAFLMAQTPGRYQDA